MSFHPSLERWYAIDVPMIPPPQITTCACVGRGIKWDAAALLLLCRKPHGLHHVRVILCHWRSRSRRRNIMLTVSRFSKDAQINLRSCCYICKRGTGFSLRLEYDLSNLNAIGQHLHLRCEEIRVANVFGWVGTCKSLSTASGPFWKTIAAIVHQKPPFFITLVFGSHKLKQRHCTLKVNE